MKRKIVILHNQVLSNSPDELDVISQRDLVKRACQNLNYEVTCLTVNDHLKNDIEKIIDEQPDLVFNLVEALWGKGELNYVAPAILNSLKIPYSGVPLDALFLTTNKVLAKNIMRHNHLPTADYFRMGQLSELLPGKTYIVKPIWEEASVGISDESIFSLSEKDKFEKIQKLPPSHYFIEEFIDGREFNISILADKNGAEVLPPAEIIFDTYFNNKPKIVGYKAKWEDESEEYKQTNRAFGTLKNNLKLQSRLIKICQKTWEVFNLKGYARVDFRVDKNENIYILEINGNPCIAPDSGFVAAVNYSGYTIEMMIDRILKDLNN